jgi:hypothetical protein
MSTVIVRDFRAADAPQLNDVALAAFLQFKDQYSDWPAMANGVSKMSELAESGEIIVAEDHAHRVVSSTCPPASQRPHTSINLGQSFACWLLPHTVGAAGSDAG